MSADRLKQLAVALIVLLALWGGASLLRNGSEDISGDFEFPQFDSAQLSAIYLVQAGDSINLVLGPQGWRVNEFAADQDLIDRFVSQLADSAVTAELVSVNPESHSRMGVDPSGTAMTLIGSSGEIGRVILGNRGPAFGTVYARLPDSDETYLLRTSLASSINRDIDDWRDKRIVQADPDSIGAVDVERPSRGYSLARADSGWAFSDGSPADSGAVARMLERFRSLRATGFASDTDEVDLETPDMTVTVADRTGARLARLVFDSAGTDYWVRAIDGGTVYKLPGFSVRQLAPADSLVRPRE
jgi:hypothetical protein